MAHTKTFKAGEVAYGGLIRVSLNNKTIHVQFLDWNTKVVVIKQEFSTKGSRGKILHFVEENSTYYWGSNVVEWIEKKIQNPNEFIMANDNWLW